MHNKIIDEDTGEILFSGNDEELKAELDKFKSLFTNLIGASEAILESFDEVPPDKKIQLTIWAGQSIASLELILNMKAPGEDNEEVN